MSFNMDTQADTQLEALTLPTNVHNATEREKWWSISFNYKPYSLQ